MPFGKYLVYIVIFLVACSEPPPPKIPAGRFKDAAAYNDYIIGWIDSLRVADTMLSSPFITGKSPAKLTKATKLFREKALRIADTLSGLEGWKGDTSLRYAATEVVRNWADVPQKYYLQLWPILNTRDDVDTSTIPDSLALSDTLSPEDTLDPNAALIPRYEAIQHRIEKAQGDVFYRFLKTQQAFAKKFNFYLPRTAQVMRGGS